jgi:hypothetical protein
VVTVTKTLNFYDVLSPEGVSGASITIENLTTDEPAYNFTEEAGNNGFYIWEPDSPTDTFGIVGSTYRLNVTVEGEEYESFSILNPVPDIDSIRFNFIEEGNFNGEYYQAEFFAVEFQNTLDYYWIKGFYNGIFLGQPHYIIASVDGSFSENTSQQNDTSIFIPTIRTSINPFPTNSDDDTEPGYAIGDSAGVELHSITEEAFLYLNEIKTQTDRPGGTSELFAVPMTNLNGNIASVNEENADPLGFFVTSNFSSSGKRLTGEIAETAKKK